MASLKEYSFAVAVNAAQQVRQNAIAAAFAAYAFNPANLTTYTAALVAADVAFWGSVNTAATSNGISPTAVDDAIQYFPNTWANILT